MALRVWSEPARFHPASRAPSLRQKAKRKLIKLVKNGAKATAKITVTLTDTAGNATSAKVTVKLKK